MYALSALAYKNLILTKKKQAIVISGESGAGKKGICEEKHIRKLLHFEGETQRYGGLCLLKGSY